MTLPIPKDVDFEMPVKEEKEFFNSNPQDWDEDEDLLKTGEWKDIPDDSND